jgi:hypothetical protein
VKNKRCNFLRGIPAMPEEVGWSTNSALQQLSQYINIVPRRQTPRPWFRWPANASCEES